MYIVIKILLFVQISTEFKKWKLKVEDKCCCKFVKQTGEKLDSHNEKVTYYQCNRSGTYKPKLSRKRNPKSQGSYTVSASLCQRLYI